MAFTLSYELRKQFPDLYIMINCGGGSLKNQFKKADKSGAQIALILAEEELQTNMIAIKNLRNDTPQALVKHAALKEYINDILAS